MSWSRPFLVFSLACLVECSSVRIHAADVCPAHGSSALRSVDVFDGLPQELVTLVPDKGDEHAGYWDFGYVYDAGRFVSIRCKYADGGSVDEKLSHRVSRCDYAIDLGSTLSLQCN